MLIDIIAMKLYEHVKFVIQLAADEQTPSACRAFDNYVLEPRRGDIRGISKYTNYEKDLNSSKRTSLDIDMKTQKALSNTPEGVVLLCAVEFSSRPKILCICSLILPTFQVQIFIKSAHYGRGRG